MLADTIKAKCNLFSKNQGELFEKWISNNPAISDKLDRFKDLNVIAAEIADQDVTTNLLQQISGDRINNFNHEAEAVSAQINHFLVLNKTEDLPNEEAKEAIYTTLRAKLLALSVTSKIFYDKWINDNQVKAEKIDRFIDLENEPPINNQENVEVESNTYAELTTAYDQAYPDVFMSSTYSHIIVSSSSS